MTATQARLQMVATELARKYGFELDDEINLNWHDDPELPQELYFYVKFNDTEVDDIVQQADIPVFLSISEHGVRFDVDSTPVAEHDKHDKFSRRSVNAAKRFVVENYAAFV